MKKRLIGYAVWLLLAACLYFFENNTGSRAVLACTLLLPLIPDLRRALFSPDEPETRPRPEARSIHALSGQLSEELGDVRAYQPGDPLNRIHWKLSARRDMLLVREFHTDPVTEETERTDIRPETRPFLLRKRTLLIRICLGTASAALILLFALPSARLGVPVLANRLFEASEEVNAYVYERFPVSPDQPAAAAAVLTAVIVLALSGAAFLSRSRLPAFLPAAACVLGQVWFGLSFPFPVQMLLFLLFSVRMLRRPRSGKVLGQLAAAAAVTALAVMLFVPGVDSATEEASERVRDSLSRMAGQMAGTSAELPAGETETRHVHTESLTSGEQESRTEKEYRLVTLEEEQISIPRWIDYLKTALLFVLILALLILPFMPFVLLNARRKKALEVRRIFQSDQIGPAVCAIFQQTVSWLEAMGFGAGNLPYLAWAEHLTAPEFPEGYAERFRACAELFEEAAYSGHPLEEAQRQQALALLEETEEFLQRRATRRQALRLKYKECLWV